MIDRARAVRSVCSATERAGQVVNPDFDIFVNESGIAALGGHSAARSSPYMP